MAHEHLISLAHYGWIGSFLLIGQSSAFVGLVLFAPVLPCLALTKSARMGVGMRAQGGQSGKRHSRLTGLLSWVTSVALLLACMGVAFELASLATGVVVQVRHAEAVQAAHQAAHAEIYAAVFAGGSFREGTVWQRAERDHFLDVARLVWWGRAVLLVSSVWVAVLIWRRPVWRGLVVRQAAQLVMAGALLTVLVGSQWTLANRLLHPLLFPHGNWSFSSDRYLITRLYDGAVLAMVAAVWAILAIGLATLAAYVWYRWSADTDADADSADMIDQSSQPSQAMVQPGLSQRWQWLIVVPVASAGAVAAWWLGWWPVLPGDAGHWVYYGLLLILAVGCWGTCARQSWGLRLLVVGVCWYGGLVVGVRAAMSTAAAEAQAAQPAVAAIEQFHREHGRLPNLAELPPLPLLSTGTGVWYLTHYRNGRDFVFGFVGPLGYHFNWRTVRNDGKGGWRLARYYGVP